MKTAAPMEQPSAKKRLFTKRLPDTIVSRAVLILVGALLALHLVGYWTYRVGAEGLATIARDRGLAERIVSIKRAIASTPDAIGRDKAAHALATASLDVHWSRSSLVLDTAPMSERATAMAKRLRELVPDFAAEAFRVGFADDGALGAGDGDSYRHMMQVSVRLDDGSWINFASPTFGTTHYLAGHILLLATCFGIGIVVIAVFLLRWVTRPLRDLAMAADRFSLENAHGALSEEGPAEVRRAAKAFNAMGERIRKLVAERTQALAAVSHDLRTPITRLRLRAELLDDNEARAEIEADLADMEAMIDSTLEFLKVGASSEPRRMLDLPTLIETMVNDQADRGRAITLSGVSHAPVEGRLIALKRAFWNILGNALKYANTVEVEVKKVGAEIVVTVEDDGPGIPESERAKVFEPFYRVETSRSRETGGTGLGLTIARAILREHGGDVTLSSREGRGLMVEVRLPGGQQEPRTGSSR